MPIAASSGELSNALDLHVGTEREGCDTDASACRRVLGEVLLKGEHGQSCTLSESVSPHLKVHLVHRCEIAREVCKEDVAFEHGIAGDASALQDLGHVFNGSAL